MTTYEVVGKPVTREDGPEKVSGAHLYPADVARPGMIFGKVLRSPFPHARIISVDTSRAESLPGVLAVVTGRDLPGMRVGRFLRDVPPLAEDRVRFVGEKVAAVAADGRVYVAYQTFDSTCPETTTQFTGEDPVTDREAIHVAVSTDGGATFGTPVRAACQYELPFNLTLGKKILPPTVFRVNSFPSMAVNPANGETSPFRFHSTEETPVTSSASSSAP